MLEPPASLVSRTAQVQEAWATYSPRALAVAQDHTPHLVALSAILVFGVVFRSFEASRREAGVSISLPAPEEARKGWKGPQPTASPTVRDAANPTLIHAFDPSTAQTLAHIPADTSTSIELKVHHAKQAQLKWAKSSWPTRRKVLRTMKRWLVDDAENIARVACRDTGKTAVDAVLGELLTTIAKIDYMIANGEKVLRPETRPNTSLLLAHKKCRVYHEPLGVVAACVSWNYPCHNALSPVIAALTAGNSIVVKASEMVVWSSTYFIAGVRACLRACDVDEDVVQLVCCFPEAADALTRHPDISHITFIGSETVGKLVATAAASCLTATCMELGGKDPMLVLPGCDLDFFVPTWLRASFGAGGQNCIGAERFIVPRKLLPRFISLVEPRVKALRCGSFLDDTAFSGDASKASKNTPSVDVGAMISDNRLAHLEDLIKDAVKRGARCLVGGTRFRHPVHQLGFYFSPTFIVDVTPDMPIAQEELFAPVFLVMAYDTVDEAVGIANGSRFALGSSVFGADRKQCYDVAARLKAGMVNINDFAVSYLNQALPFGGVKASGYGRFGGPEGLLSLTSTKAVTEDYFFRLIRTSIPPPLDYPIANPWRAWGFAKGLINLVGGTGVTQRAKGIWGLAKNSL